MKIAQSPENIPLQNSPAPLKLGERGAHTLLTPSEIFLDEEETKKSTNSIINIADILDSSSVRFQLKNKKISAISTPTKCYQGFF